MFVWERCPRRDEPLWPTSIRPEGGSFTKKVNPHKTSAVAGLVYSPVRAR